MANDPEYDPELALAGARERYSKALQCLLDGSSFSAEELIGLMKSLQDNARVHRELIAQRFGRAHPVYRALCQRQSEELERVVARLAPALDALEASQGAR